jgi:hypothetical protein
VNRLTARWLLVVVGVLLWVVAVLPAYYVIHRPLTFEPAFAVPTLSPNAHRIALAILSLLADVGLLVLTLIVAAGWGSRIGRWLGITYESGLECWALGSTLGLGLLGSAVLGLGAVGGFHRWLGYAVLLILGLTALTEVQALFGWFATQLQKMQFEAFPWLWLYTGLIGLLTVGLALLPPTGWDALVYHLQGPRLYLEAHRLTAVPENFYLNWPAQVEMLFTWGMLLKGDTLAKLLHWVFWPLTAALLYALTRRVVDARAGRWAVALWASVPVAAELAGVAYVDLGLTAFVLAGVYAFLRWTESQSDAWLALSALFAGLAIATKYTAIVWLALLVMLLIYHAWRHQRQSITWICARVASLALVAGLIVLPWLMKNWIVTGNPVYPFLFEGIGWNPTREGWLTWTGHGYSRNLLDYLALPWLMTVLGRSGTAAFDATIGPLLLCLVPLAFLVRGRPRAVNYGLVLVAGQFFYFAAMIYRYVYLAESRLLLPTFPLLCMAAAFGLHQLPTWDRESLRLSWVVGVVIALALVTNLFAEIQTFSAIHPLHSLVGLESREDYLTRRLGAHFESMHQMDEQLPALAKTLFFWEPRAYYSQRTVLADATLDNLAQLRLVAQDVETALAMLGDEGFTHLLLFQAGLEFIQAPTPRPPTLGSFLDRSPPEDSLYPLTGDDLNFLETLLDHCQAAGNIGETYGLCELP